MIIKHLVKNVPKNLLQWKALISVGESLWYQHVFLSEMIRLTFIYQWLFNPQKIQKCPPHKYDWKYETIWNEPYETISFAPFHHLLPPPGTDRCPSKHSSGLDDIRASNWFRYGRNAKWKVLIAQCWSESTRQAARGGGEQYGEGKRGKLDTSTEPWKLGLRNETSWFLKFQFLTSLSSSNSWGG